MNHNFVEVRNSKCYRGWINAPSTLQVDHEFHGMKVIVMDEGIGETVMVWPLSGPTICMMVMRLTVAKGWN